MAKYLLKNKDTVIAIVNFVPEANAFISIDEWINPNFAPITIKNSIDKKYLNPLKELNNWYQNRGIPQYRDELNDLLVKLNVDNISELKRNSYALSLSDQYWFHPIEENIEWKDVNFFTNDFHFLEFANAVFSSLSKTTNDVYSSSPNFSTDGMVKKAWIIDNNIRTLLKGGYKKSRQEPFNELLASMICKELKFDYVPYYLKDVNNQIVSACPTFIDSNTELISAADIFFSEKINNSINDYNHYISLLEKNGILDARIHLENMIVLDYLMLNEDRHMRNFGVIRDVNTLEWIKVAPIYDTGQSLLSQTDYLDMNFNKGNGKFFTNIQMPFDKIILNVQDLTRYDFQSLFSVIDRWELELHRWNEKVLIPEERIDRIVEGIKTRIKKAILIQDIQKQQNQDIEYRIEKTSKKENLQVKDINRHIRQKDNLGK